jgi:hypothetical protein
MRVYRVFTIYDFLVCGESLPLEHSLYGYVDLRGNYREGPLHPDDYDELRAYFAAIDINPVYEDDPYTQGCLCNVCPGIRACLFTGRFCVTEPL